VAADDIRGVGEISVDRTSLYREENYTDLKVASIRRLVPVRVDGSDDPTRDPIYVGHTTLLSQAGPVPVSFPIDARSLAEALDKFPAAVKEGVERLIEEAREFQREQAGRIVVPDALTTSKIIPG
jgi:hypothetical protein